MKVCVIGRALPEKKTGLNGIFEFEQAVALRKAGHHVYYAYCDVRSVRYQHEFRRVVKAIEGVNVIGYNLPLGGIPSFLLREIKSYYLKKAIQKMVSRAGEIDICHIHFPLLSVDEKNLRLIHSMGMPIVVTEHWTKVQQKMLSESQAKQLKLTAEYSEKIICVSEQLGAGVRSYLDAGTNDEKIIVIPNMVGESFLPAPFFHSAFTFLYTGCLESVKKCDLLIEAFERAFPDREEKIALLIAGNGTQRDELERLKRELNDDRIQFLGYVAREDMPALYGKCDAYVSASELETFGVPFAEAWCCGKAIICADNSPILPYVQEGINGYLFQLNNVADLSGKLRKMYEERAKFNEKAISETARECFSPEAIAEKLSRIYSSVIKK